MTEAELSLPDINNKKNNAISNALMAIINNMQIMRIKQLEKSMEWTKYL